METSLVRDTFSRVARQQGRRLKRYSFYQARSLPKKVIRFHMLKQHCRRDWLLTTLSYSRVLVDVSGEPFVNVEHEATIALMRD